MIFFAFFFLEYCSGCVRLEEVILHSESDLPVHEEVLDASGDPLCVYGDVSALGNEIFIESSPGPSR